VCWDLLDLLRTIATEFSVRGRHSILSPVQLPSWLPRHILEAMITKYEKYLVQEVTIMMTPDCTQAAQHGRSETIQSAAGLSNAGSEETSSSMILGHPRKG